MGKPRNWITALLETLMLPVVPQICSSTSFKPDPETLLDSISKTTSAAKLTSELRTELRAISGGFVRSSHASESSGDETTPVTYALSTSLNSLNEDSSRRYDEVLASLSTLGSGKSSAAPAASDESWPRSITSAGLESSAITENLTNQLPPLTTEALRSQPLATTGRCSDKIDHLVKAEMSRSDRDVFVICSAATIGSLLLLVLFLTVTLQCYRRRQRSRLKRKHPVLNEEMAMEYQMAAFYNAKHHGIKCNSELNISNADNFGPVSVDLVRPISSDDCNVDDADCGGGSSVYEVVKVTSTKSSEKTLDTNDWACPSFSIYEELDNVRPKATATLPSQLPTARPPSAIHSYLFSPPVSAAVSKSTVVSETSSASLPTVLTARDRSVEDQTGLYLRFNEKLDSPSTADGAEDQGKHRDQTYAKVVKKRARLVTMNSGLPDTSSSDAGSLHAPVVSFSGLPDTSSSAVASLHAPVVSFSGLPDTSSSAVASLHAPVVSFSGLPDTSSSAVASLHAPVVSFSGLPDTSSSAVASLHAPVTSVSGFPETGSSAAANLTKPAGFPQKADRNTPESYGPVLWTGIQRESPLNGPAPLLRFKEGQLKFVNSRLSGIESKPSSPKDKVVDSVLLDQLASEARSQFAAVTPTSYSPRPVRKTSAAVHLNRRNRLFRQRHIDPAGRCYRRTVSETSDQLDVLQQDPQKLASEYLAPTEAMPDIKSRAANTKANSPPTQRNIIGNNSRCSVSSGPGTDDGAILGAGGNRTEAVGSSGGGTRVQFIEGGHQSKANKRHLSSYSPPPGAISKESPRVMLSRGGCFSQVTTSSPKYGHLRNNSVAKVPDVSGTTLQKGLAESYKNSKTSSDVRSVPRSQPRNSAVSGMAENGIILYLPELMTTMSPGPRNVASGSVESEEGYSSDDRSTDSEDLVSAYTEDRYGALRASDV